MSDNAQPPEHNSVWTFDADVKTGRYLLTIEYHAKESEDSMDHDRIHAWIKNQALQWMIGRGIDPAAGTVKILCDRQLSPEEARRLSRECEAEAEPAEESRKRTRTAAEDQPQRRSESA